jgi:alkylhydroperoxidase/carboxymuconolactone decarboxylase family protein YurZ
MNASAGDANLIKHRIPPSIPSCLAPRQLRTRRKENRMADVAAETQETLSRISAGDMEMLETAVGLREANREGSHLDPRTFALVKIAALIALDAPPASYAWQIGNALAEGVTPEDIIGVLRAIAPQVGGPRIIAAGPEIMLAIGLPLDGEE